MQKVLLLYNPAAGRRRARRVADVEASAAVFRPLGIKVEIEATRGALETGEQVRQAMGAGCDTVFACGGDGTVHDVAQALAGTPVALGLIPLGTANSLACDLKVPLHPVEAARASLRARERRVALGHVAFRDFAGNPAQRYFLSIAGIGVDAHVFYQLNTAAKGRLGMIAYYLQSVRQWLVHEKTLFAVDFAVSGSSERRAENVSQVLAVRIANFGGALRELGPGADLANDDCRLVLFKTRSRLCYLLYVVRGLVGARWNVPGIELLHSNSLHADYLAGADASSRIYLQADGELLGTLPAAIAIHPDKLTLLAP